MLWERFLRAPARTRTDPLVRCPGPGCAPLLASIARRTGLREMLTEPHTSQGRVEEHLDRGRGTIETAKTIKPEASHTKPGRTLLQVKTENKKNEVEERRAEENLMMMPSPCPSCSLTKRHAREASVAVAQEQHSPALEQPACRLEGALMGRLLVSWREAVGCGLWEGGGAPAQRVKIATSKEGGAPPSLASR